MQQEARGVKAPPVCEPCISYGVGVVCGVRVIHCAHGQRAQHFNLLLMMRQRGLPSPSMGHE